MKHFREIKVLCGREKCGNSSKREDGGGGKAPSAGIQGAACHQSPVSCQTANRQLREGKDWLCLTNRAFAVFGHLWHLAERDVCDTGNVNVWMSGSGGRRTTDRVYSLCDTFKISADVQVLVNNKHVNQTWIRWGNQESVSDWYCTCPEDFCASCASLCFVR